MLVYNYDRKDDTKKIIDETIDGTVTTTYIGNAKWKSFRSSGDEGIAIWSIEKRVEDSSTGKSEKFRPNGSKNFEFIRDNRAILTYL